MFDEDKEKTVWKTYPEFPWIQANQFGEIRTVDRTVVRSDGKKQFVKGHILKQHLKKCGYMYVSFRVNGKKIYLRVHRIVASAFIPNPDNLPEVNHIDCDPTNNAVSNLEWCTSKYNCQYREKYGKSSGHPVFSVNLKTFEVSYFESYVEAGRKLGINHTHISSVVRGKQKKTGGYWFCNADKNAIKKAKVKFGDDVAIKIKELIDVKT